MRHVPELQRVQVPHHHPDSQGARRRSVSVFQRVSGPAGGASDDYGPGRGAAGPPGYHGRQGCSLGCDVHPHGSGMQQVSHARNRRVVPDCQAC